MKSTILSFAAITTLLTCWLHVTGCGKDDAAPGGGGAAGKTAAPAAVDYTAIDGLVTAAKTGDDFTNILMECGKIEINAAANGNGEMAKDATYRDHCRARPVKARAALAVAESTPDKMSSQCLGAVTGLEGLVEDKIIADEAAALLPQVKTACGM
ncbi:MAG TPA: hypothetical protein VMZ28_17980 [Kofleriaceae bacterium]|nr:hypothetical protein [Kofleriaceae bacterium]